MDDKNIVEMWSAINQLQDDIKDVRQQSATAVSMANEVRLEDARKTVMLENISSKLDKFEDKFDKFIESSTFNFGKDVIKPLLGICAFAYFYTK